MAKTDGTQNIPSELLDGYRGTLGEERPDKGVRKRYPYRVPTMQSLVGHPSTKQKEQRDKFNLVVEKFNATTWEQRQRWYAAAPEWGSILWYYNFFMMSGIMDVLGANPEGASVIKSIKHYTFTLPAPGPSDVNVAIDEIDPTRACVFLYGAGYKVLNGAAPTIYPFMKALTANQVTLRASRSISVAADCGVTVIEYI